MTDDVRNLIRFVVDGDIRNAQTQCRIMLEKNVPEKDARFKEAELKKLNLLKPEPRDEWGQGDSIADLYAKSGAVVSQVSSAKDLLNFLQTAGNARHL